MKCSVYIATSADGYIATPTGDVEWLHCAGNAHADMSASPDMGFGAYISQVDCMVMGHKSMEKISSMNLTPEQWPYGDIDIVVLSRSLKTPPENLHGRVEMYAGTLEALIAMLKARGRKHAYIDGGSTITSFLNLGLINEMTITKAPLLLGAGIPLFGKLEQPIQLENATATAFANDFIQETYHVRYG